MTLSEWIVRYAPELAARAWEHVQLTLLAVVIGLVVSFPLGVFAYRRRRWYASITTVAGLLYAIPSLALFAFLVPFTGLTFTTAEIGLVSYTLLILIRNVVAALDGVPEDVKESARGMGYTSRQMLWRVEVPLALPVIIAGVRIATVTTIGLVTVTAIIGLGGFGYFILQGLDELDVRTILVGTALSVVLAVVGDVVLVRAERRLTPWARRRGIP